MASSESHDYSTDSIHAEEQGLMNAAQCLNTALPSDLSCPPLLWKNIPKLAVPVWLMALLAVVSTIEPDSKAMAKPARRFAVDY